MKIRIFYMLDGVQKYEDIESRYVPDGRTYMLDGYRMSQHASQYAECLQEFGARNVKLEWVG